MLDINQPFQLEADYKGPNPDFTSIGSARFRAFIATNFSVNLDPSQLLKSSHTAMQPVVSGRDKVISSSTLYLIKVKDLTEAYGSLIELYKRYSKEDPDTLAVIEVFSSQPFCIVIHKGKATKKSGEYIAIYSSPGPEGCTTI